MKNFRDKIKEKLIEIDSVEHEYDLVFTEGAIFGHASRDEEVAALEKESKRWCEVIEKSDPAFCELEARIEELEEINEELESSYLSRQRAYDYRCREVGVLTDENDKLKKESTKMRDTLLRISTHYESGNELPMTSETRIKELVMECLALVEKKEK